jgi:hypothetical protein
MRIPARAFFPVALCATIIAGCAGAPSPNPPAGAPAAGAAHVRLMHRERAVPGALVTAVRNLGVAFQEERVVARAGPDGRAEITLAPGGWYLSASADEPGIFGWYGTNPVRIRAGETLEVTIPAVAASPAGSAAATPVPLGEESVSGTVVGDGGAVVGAEVAFYLDAATQFRGPGYLEVETDERGAFETRVSPGRYWLIARRRSGSQPFGPLEVGDDFGFHPGNPIVVRAGERVAVRIPAVRVLKKSGWSGPSTLRTRVSGTIRDAAGRPLAGYRAFLHAKATMLGKPEFVSEPSGTDGAYLIWVDREGTYYLGARAEIGRSREEREMLGLYRGAPDHAVAVRLGAGDLAGRDVMVEAGSAP